MADAITIALSGMNWIGVILATIAAFIVGAIWFTVLFGKRWAAEMGIPMDEKESAKSMAMPLVKDVIGNFLMAYVLFHTTIVWLPELWGAQFGFAAENAPMWQYGAYSAGFIWLGFFVPVALSRTGWERRSWTWFAIDTGYHLVKLVIMAQILVAFM